MEQNVKSHSILLISILCLFVKHKTLRQDIPSSWNEMYKRIQESMIKPVEETAGSGSPPKQYHNNCLECINNLNKMKVGRKRSPFDDFVSKMKSLVEGRPVESLDSSYYSLG